MPEYLKLLKISAGDIKKTEDGWCIDLVIPDDLPWFSGHFPSQPVLPAVITAEISDALVNAAAAKDPQMIINAKFKGPVFPGTRVLITIKLDGPESVSVLWQESAASNTSGQESFLADLRFKL